jgi:molecular chaperone DnaK (HSP70)
LKVLRVIRDATAIALSLQTEKNILIYNLGAGTLSISLVYMKKEVYEVKATEGDNHLGGIDFDNTLIEYFCNEFYK